MVVREETTVAQRGGSCLWVVENNLMFVCTYS